MGSIIRAIVSLGDEGSLIVTGRLMGAMGVVGRDVCGFFCWAFRAFLLSPVLGWEWNVFFAEPFLAGEGEGDGRVGLVMGGVRLGTLFFFLVAFFAA